MIATLIASIALLIAAGILLKMAFEEGGSYRSEVIPLDDRLGRGSRIE